MDIVTLGRQPFEVMQINQERAFLQGEVIYIEDDAVPSLSSEREQALNLYKQIMTLAGAVADSSSSVDEQQLSFHLAGSLPLDPDFKQQLLGMKSESARLQAIISFFANILPSMRRNVEVRRKAGGNGHAG